MKRANTPRIDVNQNVRSNRGTVIGVYYGPSQDPPGVETIRKYLTAVAVKEQLEADAGEAMKELWSTPFQVESRRDAASVDLYEAVEAALAEAKQSGSFQRLVLLGETGAGKSPALEHCLTEAARKCSQLLSRESAADEEATGHAGCVIPFFILLTHLLPGRSLSELVLDTFNGTLPKGELRITASQVAGLLGEYTCLLLLDNLEDLLSDEQKVGLQDIGRFMEFYRSHQYVLGCRTSSYHQQLGALRHLYLADLSASDIQRILEKLDEDLRRQLESNSAAMVMAGNRRTLRALIESDGSEDLLQTKARVLGSVVSKKLDPEGIGRGYAGLDVPMAKALLERLAIEMHCDHTLRYSDRQIMNVITGFLEEWRERAHWRDVARELDEAGLLDWDRFLRQCRFADRTFGCYFAARALVHDPNLLRTVLEEASDRWWRDVFEILMGLIPDPQRLLWELLEQDALMSADCLRFAGKSVGQPLEDAVLDALVLRMEKESVTRRRYIVERIGESGHPRAPEALLRTLHREWASSVAMAITKELRSWIDENPEAVNAAESGASFGLAGPGVSITQLLKSRAGDVPKLLECIRDRGQPPKIRAVAALCLGLIGGREARKCLLGLIREKDLYDFVAWCAIEALTLSKDGDVGKGVMDWLGNEELKGEEWSRHRARWVYLLGWQGGGTGCDEVIQSALLDGSPLVVGRALDAMARNDLYGARTCIEDTLREKGDPFVQHRAVDALAAIGTPQSLPLLEWLLNVERSPVRSSVRRAITEIREQYRM